MTPPLLDLLSADCQSVPSYESLDPTVINEDSLHLTDILTETLWGSIVFYIHERFESRCQSTVSYAKTQHDNLTNAPALVLWTSSPVQ